MPDFDLDAISAVLSDVVYRRGSGLPSRATMLAERRAREATGPTFVANPDDPELDVIPGLQVTV